MTAHAAFDKGAAYMGIKLREVPVDPVTRKVNLKRVRRAMFVIPLPFLVRFPDCCPWFRNGNTIMVGLSCFVRAINRAYHTSVL